MKKLLTTLTFFLTVITITKSQDLHSAAEILEILEKSSISYELHRLEEKIEPEDRSKILNFNNIYRVEEEDKIMTYEYEESESIKKLLAKSEEHFKNKEFDLARNYYEQILEVDPTYYKVMTYIGQTYVLEGNIEKGENWYKKSIESNYIDYMAHWFLADLYREQKQLDKALEEITIARILNINNPRIKKSFDKIYELKKINNPEWIFTPQIRLQELEKGAVKLEFHEDWMGYGLVKALWEYEPGYSESMGVKEGTLTTTEEKEAFISLMTTFNKKKLKKNPEFKTLEKSVKEDMVDEFIFYEILLPKYPNVAYQLPKDFLESISKYVIKIRGEK